MVFEHYEETEAAMRAALIEVNGFRFYKMLANRVDTYEARDALLALARDEKRHLHRIENQFFPEAGFSIDQITDEELVIQEHIDKSGTADIFTRRIDINALFKVVDTPRKALILALDTERNSVKYFEGLAEKADSKEAKDIYLDLADEEKSHVALIEGLIAALPPGE